LPVPEPPDRILSHEELLDAFQVHPAGAVIATLDAPPAAATDVEVRPRL